MRWVFECSMCDADAQKVYPDTLMGTGEGERVVHAYLSCDCADGDLTHHDYVGFTLT